MMNNLSFLRGPYMQNFIVRNMENTLNEKLSWEYIQGLGWTIEEEEPSFELDEKDSTCACA